MSIKLTPTFKYAAALAAALTLGALTGAPAVASPPPVDSPQWTLMHPFASFITKMHTHAPSGAETQWCCDWSDGRGDMVERSVTGADGKSHYQVFATPEAYGPEYNDLLNHFDPEMQKNGKWIDVPDIAVLSAKDADAECKVERTSDPNSTCKTPDFNILWLSTNGHVYCYWPTPKMGALEQKDNLGMKQKPAASRASFTLGN